MGRYDRGGGSRKEKYTRLVNTARWQKIRRQQLTDFPCCAMCQRKGYDRLATEVHHVVPIESSKSGSFSDMKRLAYSPTNLMSLCHDCHVAIHRELGSRSRDKVKAIRKEELKDFVKKFDLPIDTDTDERPARVEAED